MYTICFFGDDQIIITRKVKDINSEGRKSEEKFEKWGLDTNYGETEYLATGNSEELQINGNTTPAIKHFEYLGSIFQPNSLSELEFEKKDW
jgi:hypothetical protein